MWIRESKLKNVKDLYSWTKIIYGHIIGWAIFITAELSTIYFISHSSFAAPILDYALHYMVNIGLFYINCLVIFPKTYKSKAILQVPLFIALLLELLCYLLIVYGLNLILFRWGLHPQDGKKLWLFVVPNAYRCLLFLILSTGYWLGSYLLKSRIEIDSLIQQKLIDKNEQLELQRKVIASENALLKAQINPHFLFNSLSFLYNSIHKISPSIAEAVILLSDVTRYSLSQVDASGQLPIHEEIEQINNLIELNQLRFNGSLQIKLDVGFVSPSITVPPLLLITLVENIFKYGKLDDPISPAIISVNEVDDVLQFRISNEIQKRAGVVGYRVGLENTKLRLNNFFPDKHKLEITETETNYSVELDIQLANAEEGVMPDGYVNKLA